MCKMIGKNFFFVFLFIKRITNKMYILNAFQSMNIVHIFCIFYIKNNEIILIVQTTGLVSNILIGPIYTL